MEKTNEQVLKAINSIKLSTVKLVTVCFLWIALVAQCAAQSTPSRTLLALSKGDHVLAIIDPVSLKVVATVPVGSDPHEVIASADGKTAYVTIYGGGSLHELNVIDLVAQKALPTIDTRPFMGPHGITFVDGKVWFTAEGTKTVARYDPPTGKFDWCMGTGQNRTHMIYVSQGAKRVYTSNVSSGTVSIIVDTLIQPGPPPSGPPAGLPQMGNPPAGNQPARNQRMGPPPGFGPHRDWVQTIIPVGTGSEGFDVSPNGNELWTAASDNGEIYIINTAAAKLAAKIDAKAFGANRLKFTPDGKRVLVSSLRTGDVFVFDAITHKEIKTIKTGHGAAGILMDDDGSRAFIGCTGDNYVVVIDLKTLEVTGHIDVRGADGLAWAVRP